MSIQFVLGRSGTGKSTYCFKQIKENLELNKKSFIITPEQFSYTSEKRLLELTGKNSIIDSEVITFNRMAERIAIEVGGTTEKAMTKSTKAMLIFWLLQKNKKDFTFFGNSNENVSLIIKTITELKKNNIGPKDIAKAIENIDDISLSLKLKDVYTIYSEYEGKIKNEYIDEDDKLTKLANNLEKSTMFNDSYVYIDEFSGFTKQEYEILKKIMKKAKKVTVTFCIDAESEIEDDVFYPNKQVIKKITKIAQELNIDIEQPINLTKTHRFKNEELAHLEKNIYERTYQKYNKESKNIKLFLAANPYSEIEYVAKQIVRLVRDENYKYRDISIITKNIDSISSTAKAVFSKYNIPIYIDEKDELIQNIIIRYILSILEIFSKNWSCESVLNYIKLGFCNITKYDIYVIENYVKKWGIKGATWYKNEWDFEEDNSNINEIKNNIVNPLLKFKDSISTKKTVREISLSIHNFLQENNIYEKLNEKILFLENIGELKFASDYKLSLENLIDVLDEIVSLFGDEKISFDRYADILKVGLQYKELGSIPQKIDQVILGDVDRSRTHKVKAVFIIGMNDGIFPGINKNEGFLNDNDRETLKEVGAEISQGTLGMLYEEEYNIYKAMNIAEEKIYLSYTSSDKEGSPLRSSSIITKVKKVFPNLMEESDVISRKTEISTLSSTFEEMLYNFRNYKDGEEINPIWFDVYSWYDKNWHDKLQEALKGLNYTNNIQPIKKENIEKLYGKILKTSVSQLEQYKNCPFSFYLKYGLKLKEQDEFKIKSIDTGSFMHDVIDVFFERTEQEEINKLTEEETKKIVYKIIDEKLNLKRNWLFTSTQKFVVLTNRLKRIVAESIYYIVCQMQNSDFKVLGNEVEFEKQLGNAQIVGKIDRIDIAENEDGEFIRIIDYKSSIKNLDLNKIVSGIQIQLLTYMDAMVEKTNKEPAGVLYFNLIEPIISKNKNLTDEEIKKEIRKSFKMRGFILSDIKVIKMMDKELEKGPSLTVPATIDKDGNISEARSSVLSKEQFSILQKKIKKLIEQISEEILKGKIEIKPTYNTKQKKSACEYCSYQTICRFNSKEDNYMYLSSKTKEEIFREIENEE